MRLLRKLDSSGIVIENFVGDPPKYAILSHTWGPESEEVSYQDMIQGNGRSKAGFKKIEACAEQAAAAYLEYFWVDTCCIDKSSSAELSEAINSMFKNYANSALCIAYLCDVTSNGPAYDPSQPDISGFRSSRWFTRGWTLQELIAPKKLVFFSKDWQAIGTKWNLRQHISEITAIDVEALEGVNLEEFSVAKRMAWAACRETTRTEDKAYCLLGIFDVNIPLLYGEGGERSFIRLQEEIIKYSDDHSILAWVEPHEELNDGKITGLLARSPQCFLKSSDISPLGILGNSRTFNITNKGLCVDLFLMSLAEERQVAGIKNFKGVYRASLDCAVKGAVNTSPIIYLARFTDSNEGAELNDSVPQFCRVQPWIMHEAGNAARANGEYKTIFVPQSREARSKRTIISTELTLGMTIFRVRHSRPGVRPSRAYPPARWNPQTQTVTVERLEGKVMALWFDYTRSPAADRLRYMVIVGRHVYQDSGTRLWTRVLAARFNKGPDSAWAEYAIRGTEQAVSRELCRAEGGSKGSYGIQASLQAISAAQGLAFVVQVSETSRYWYHTHNNDQ